MDRFENNSKSEKTLKKLKKQTFSTYKSESACERMQIQTNSSFFIASNNKRIFFLLLFTIILQIIDAHILPTTALQHEPVDKNASFKNETKRDCYKTILHQCGRRFISSYKFVAGENNADANAEDILTSQCALRTAFFTCLSHKTRDCKELLGKNTHDILGRIITYEDEPRDPELRKHRLLLKMRKFQARRTRRDNIFRERLSNTIWDSRICIFRGSIRVIDKHPSSTESSIP